ncbi:MAG: hypothetical protein M1820_008157 [Bogoriella megaspora]|nr:MAG: hypothetical protein M1820_008157 [Bogoriella megaspora]
MRLAGPKILSGKRNPPRMKGSSKPEEEVSLAEKELPATPSARRHIWESWVWEVASLVLSVSSFAAIAITVGLFNNKPPSSWKFDLTLNGVVSFLAVLNKAALVMPVASCISQLKWIWFASKARRLEDFEDFDEASRGPLGSLKLLWDFRFRRLASLGSVVIIVAVLIDPFFQNILTTKFVDVSAGTGSIARASSYILGPPDENNTLYPPPPPLAMKGAIQSGILGSTGLGATVSPACPTEPHLQFYNVSNEFGNRFGWSLQTPNNTVNYSASIENSNSVILTTAGPADFSPCIPLLTGGPPCPLTIAFRNATQQLIVDFFIMKNRDKTTTSSVAMPPPLVNECALYYCGRSYVANMTNGQFSETVLDEWHNVSTTADGNKRLVGPKDQDSFTLDTVASSKFRTTESLSWYLSVQLYGAPTGTLHTTVGDNTPQAFITDAVGAVVQAMNETTNRNISTLMADVAQSMTTYVRTQNASDLPAFGTAYKTEAQTAVRWYWLYLSGIPMILGIAFVILTLWTSHRQGVRVWKSSVRALLSNGADDNDRFLLVKEYGQWRLKRIQPSN